MGPAGGGVVRADVGEGGAGEAEPGRVRGRAVGGGARDRTGLRYGQLAGVGPGVRVGTNVYRGQVLGFVGNSGTDRAVTGSQDGARLRFEIWTEDGEFFGAGLDATEVRLAAATLFVGP